MKRLGRGPDNAQELKGHPVFRDIDGNLLAEGKITPRWKPSSSILDTSQFDHEFTSVRLISPDNINGSFYGFTHGFLKLLVFREKKRKNIFCYVR